MKTVYIADDGKQFDDEYECEQHEFKLKYPHLQTIEVYNQEGEKMTDLLDDDTYNDCNRIVIHSEDELSDLLLAADHLGFYSYNDITEIGEWVFDYETEHFRKNEKSTFIKELSDKYVAELNKYNTENTEADHKYADDAIVELLSDLEYAEAVEVYKKSS